MTLAVQPDPPVFVPPPSSVKRFTVEEYHKAIEAEAVDADERVELLEGWIVYKVTHNPIHDMTVDRVQEALRDRVSKDWRIRVQSAITTQDSEPEPDVVVAQGPATRYRQRHPGPQDIALLVEVADSSLDRDRDKATVYARAGISVYWIVNLPESIVEVYADPTASPRPKYQTSMRFGLADSVPLSVAGQPLRPILVRDLLP
jgi:Uma2 family endonuclease